MKKLLGVVVPVNLGLRKLMQEDLEFKASMNNKARLASQNNKPK